MDKVRYRLFFFMLVIALVAIPTAAALAKEFGMLTVTGPGIQGELKINQRDELSKLEGSGFFDPEFFDGDRIAKAPENLGEGYNITSYLNLDSKLIPTIQMVYYPLTDGKPGYVHWIAVFDAKAQSVIPTDRWGQMRPGAETAFRGLMDAYGVNIQTAVLAASGAAAPQANESAVAQPAVAPSVSPMTIQPIYLATAAAILLLLGAGFVLRRRVIHQRSS